MVRRFGAKEAVCPSMKDGKPWIWLAPGIESAAERTAFAGR
ncbi:hypothetical protein [Streptomyces sp. NPDC050287]